MFPQRSNSKSVHVCFHFLFWLTTFFVVQFFTHHVPLSGQLEEVFKHRPSTLSLLPFSVWSLHSQGPAQSEFERERVHLANQDWESESEKVIHFSPLFASTPKPTKYKYCDNCHKFFYISWLPWCTKIKLGPKSQDITCGLSLYKLEC